MPTRVGACPQSLFGEFFFDEAMQMITNHRVIEASDHFVEESGDEEALGYLCRNAAGAQIEEFVLVDLTGCRAVSATDVVSEDF